MSEMADLRSAVENLDLRVGQLNELMKKLIDELGRRFPEPKRDSFDWKSSPK